MSTGVHPELHTLEASASRPREQSHDSDFSYGAKIAHTLTACCRCRSRKTKCDAGLPRCGPCDRTGSTCDYFDTTKGRKIPRTYVIHLQNKVKQLELDVAKLEEEALSLALDPEDVIRDPGFVSFEESEEARFMGSSSGLAITRLVFERAKENMGASRISDVVPQGHRLEKKKASESHPGPLVEYPLTSSVAAPDLPTRSLADKLVEVFSQRAQFLLPTLHEPTLVRNVQSVYSGSTDPYENFVVRLVLAISMQKLDAQYAGLADSYYLAALPYLKDVLRPMDVKTLQCCVLVAQYSLLTPTRTAVYLIVGLAVRLCQQLGLSQEKTIAPPALNLTALQLDMRRRLAWIVASMEYGLSHILGRPSALSLGDDDLDVGFFAPFDDEYISDTGIAKGPASSKKLIAMHFFRMRLLQAEIRRRLYENKRLEPRSDDDPWFHEMEERLSTWRAGLPGTDSSSGIDAVWFTARYNTMIIFMYRPSPQIPEVTDKAVTKCYNAAIMNIHIMKRMLDERSTDLTWIFVQQVYMLINTTLWTVSYSHIRTAHPQFEVETHIDPALEMLQELCKRWPGTESALEMYRRLISATLLSYEEREAKSNATSPMVGQKPSPSATSLSSFNISSSSDFGQSPFGYHFSPNSDPTLSFDHSPFSANTSPEYIATTSPTPFGASPDPTAHLSPDPLSWSTTSNFPFSPGGLISAPLHGPGVNVNNGNVLPDFTQFISEQQAGVSYLSFDFGTGVSSTTAQERIDSLDMQQQAALMNSLETEGTLWLDTYLDRTQAFNRALARQYEGYAPG